MKKNTKALLISIIIILLVGAGLLFWVQYSSRQDKQGSRIEENFTKENTNISSDNDDLEQEGSALSGEETDNSQISGDYPEEGTEPENTTEPEPEPQDVTLAFTGDILLSTYVLNNYDREGITGVLSEKLLSEMQNADITMANEEFPFSTRGTQAEDKQFTFRVNPSYVTAFTDMGIDVVTLANNHALDFGREALSDSFDTLDGAGIPYVGAGDTKERAAQPFIVEMEQKTFGFLAASRVIPVVEWNIENSQPGMLCTYDSAALCEAIRDTKEQCDYVVVYVHWGIERENTPQEYQRQLAKNYIDAGADLVIGAHPHVLQGIEYYNGKPIVYSLGNFIFNQEIGSTVLLKATITPENETSLQLIPAYASGAKTQEMSEEKASELYQFMESISFGVAVGADGVVTEKENISAFE